VCNGATGCLNNGICVADGICHCLDGFSGTFCGTTDPADPGKPAFCIFQFMSVEHIYNIPAVSW
jgi:hypothetical protein